MSKLESRIVKGEREHKNIIIKSNTFQDTLWIDRRRSYLMDGLKTKTYNSVILFYTERDSIKESSYLKG